MSRTIRQAGVNARHLGGGFVRTANGEAWQYMVMPSQPSVSDAADWSERLKAARPLTIIMPRLADLTPSIPLANRRALKSFYRPIHILAMSTPVRFEPSPTLDERNRRLLAMEHRGDVVHDRLTVIGVRLDAGGGKGRFLDRVVNLVVQAGDQAAYGEAPDDAFDTDRAVISEILRAGGCVPPTDAQMNRALAWWVTDRKPDPLEVMVERGHMHAFPDERTARLAEKLRDTRVDCETWSKRIEIRGTWPMTIATLGALPFDGTSERDPRSAWAAHLLASRDSGGQGAVAISVRGLVEPGEISRDQIDKDKDKVLEQAIKQATDGHKANEGIAEELLAASDVYQKDGHHRQAEPGQLSGRAESEPGQPEHGVAGHADRLGDHLLSEPRVLADADPRVRGPRGPLAGGRGHGRGTQVGPAGRAAGLHGEGPAAGLRQSVRLEVQAHPTGHAHHRKDRFRKGQYS